MAPRSPVTASMSVRAKLLVTVTAVGATAAVAGLGTYGTFTSTTSASSGSYASGTTVLDYGAAGTTNRLSVGASAMAPGDTAQRGFTLRNSGSLNLASVALNLSASPSSLLDTDTTNGLTLGIQACPAPGWVESAATPYTYTCVGTVSTVLAVTPVATLKTSSPNLSGLASLTAGSSDSLLATVTLPAGANNTVQGLSSTLAVSFVGTQRAATSK